MTVDIKDSAVETAWRGPDLVGQDDWLIELTEQDVLEIEAAIEEPLTRGTGLGELTADDLPLPTVAAKVARWRTELEDGKGFLLVRGLPVRGYSLAKAQLAYWALGVHLGSPVHQNAAGDLLGSVRDTGRKYAEKNVRGYQTKSYLPFHTDSSDIVGLLCWRPARSGGLSRIVSSSAIYNEILRRRPELIELLYGPWYFDRRGEEAEGELPYYDSPLCAYLDGKLSMRYIRNHVETAQNYPDVPRLTQDQRDLLDLIDELSNSPELTLDMEFRQGDIQYLNNYTILHSRTEYEDFEEPEKKRHLFRLWLTLPDGRRLPDNWGRDSGRVGATGAAGRGGVTPRSAGQA